MGCAHRPARHERPAVQKAGDAVDHRHLDRFIQRERRQDRRQAAGEHGLARAWRPNEQHVVAPGRGHLESPPRMRLPADVGEVAGGERGGGEERLAVDGRRGTRRLTADVGDGLGDGLDADHGRAAGERRLGGVRRGDDEPLQRCPPRRRRDRQGAADGVDTAVEPELAENAPAVERRERSLAVGREDAEGDRQVERGALLADAGGGQVHRDALRRILEARVAKRGADSVARLAHGAVREPHRGGVRQAGGYVDLHRDEDRVDPPERPRADAGEHAFRLPRAATRRNR